MMSIQPLIDEITATGAQLIVTDEGVGLSKPIPESLLSLAKTHKAEIARHIQQQDTKRGLKILKQLSAGLPTTDDELAGFYADDLQYIGSGEVAEATIKYSLSKLVGGRPQPEIDERVRCTDCTQYRCRRPTRQYSSALRNCNQYDAKS